MAKKYLEIFRDSAETQYASGVFPLMSLAALNEGVNFKPTVPSQTRTSNGGDQFVIQRLKRVKASNAPAQTGKAGTDLVAVYDTAQRIDWDTIGVKTGVKKWLLVEDEKFDYTDILEDASAYTRTIANKTKNLLIEAEEVATETLFAGAPNAATATVFTDASTPQAIADGLFEAVHKIEVLVDDFKAYSDNVVVIIHPILAKRLGELEGQSYQNGTNTFPNGTGKSFTYQQIEFYVSPILNAIESGTNTGNVCGAIVLDKEAYANAGFQTSLVEIAETRLDKTFFGHCYNYLQAIVDSARIEVFEYTPKSVTKKVND